MKSFHETWRGYRESNPAYMLDRQVSCRQTLSPLKLDFGVTVSTKQIALVQLFSHRIKICFLSQAKMKSLRRSISMMKVQRGQTSAITTSLTTSTLVLHSLALQSATAFVLTSRFLQDEPSSVHPVGRAIDLYSSRVKLCRESSPEMSTVHSDLVAEHYTRSY